MDKELNRGTYHIWSSKNLKNIKDIRKNSFDDYANFQLDKKHKGSMGSI